MDASERRRRGAQEAAEWWVLLQGECTRLQREQYVDWLRESPIHVAEMLHIAQIHGALSEFERWGRLPIDSPSARENRVVELAAGPRRTETFIRAPLVRHLKIYTITAALLVLAVLGAINWLWIANQVIQTDRGERREVALADGTVLEVDPLTRLRVRYETRIRRITLEQGRALFRVSKNPKRPFLVEAQDATVRAVGTAFAVERRLESVVVTVAEGKVAVDSTPSPILSSTAANHATINPSTTSALSLEGSANRAPRAPDVQAPSEIYLIANQQITVPRNGSAGQVHQIDSARLLSWSEGKLIFENDSVAYAIEQFNRYNRLQLSVHDPDLGRRPISGVFNAADPESFIAFIQSVVRVQVTRNEAGDVSLEKAF